VVHTYIVSTEGRLSLLIYHHLPDTCTINTSKSFPSLQNLIMPSYTYKSTMPINSLSNRTIIDLGGPYGKGPYSPESSDYSQDERRSYESDPDALHRSRTPSTSSDSGNSQYSEHGRRPSPPPARKPRGTLTFRASSPPQRRKGSDFDPTAPSRRRSASVDSGSSQSQRSKEWTFAGGEWGWHTPRRARRSTASRTSAKGHEPHQSYRGFSVASPTMSGAPSVNNNKLYEAQSGNDHDNLHGRGDGRSILSGTRQWEASLAHSLWRRGRYTELDTCIDRGGLPFDRPYRSRSQGGRHA